MAYNSIYTGQQIDNALRDGEWYNLQCFSDGVPAREFRFRRKIVIENYNPSLLDAEKYRLVFLQQRRVVHKGLVWRTPMFGAMNKSQNAYPMSKCYVAVTDRSNIIEFDESLWRFVERPRNTGPIGVVARTRNTKSRMGYALYKNTGVGTFGWQRVSNIVGISVALGRKRLQTGANYAVFTE